MRGATRIAIGLWICGVAAAAEPVPAEDAAASDPRAGAIGLLQLPEVYGTEPCQRFRPRPVRVYAAAGATEPVGEIRTTQYWTWPKEGGCEGLRVDYVPARGDAGPLPSQEFAAEQPAAIVLEQRGDWYRVRLPGGSGWIRATPRNEYGPLLALLQRDLEGFTDPAGAGLRASPTAGAATVWQGVPSCAVPRVVGSDASGPEPWIEVELVRDVCCADDAPATPAGPVRGWLPLYRADGVPSVWFASRGC